MDVFHALTVLLQSSICGLALTVAIGCVLWLLTPVNASTRFAVWFATLIAVAALPPAFLIWTAVPRLSKNARAFQPVPAASVRTSSIASEPAPPARPFESEPASQKQVLVSPDAAFTLLGTYSIFVMVLFGRLGVSYVRIRRLKRSTSPALTEVGRRFESWLSLAEIGRPVQLLVSTKVRSPMAVGFAPPAVIIP